MDRLFCMQVFVRVVENGAFTRAAESMGIARATATAAVAELERKLNVRLLNRTTRRMSVTEEGQSYYASCVRLLGEVAEAEDALSGARQVPRGRLRVSVPNSFVDALFFPALARFHEQYPELEIELVFTDRAVNLVEEGVDCALRGVEIPEDSGLVARRLSACHWLTCAAPSYLAEAGVPQEPADLVHHSCIWFISPSTGRPRDWLFRDGDKTISMVPSGKLRLTSFHAAVQVATATGGIIQIPDLLGYSAVRKGLLQPILTRYVADAPPLHLVYPGSRYVPAKVRVFKEFMLQIFPREGWWAEIEARSAVPAQSPLKSA